MALAKAGHPHVRPYDCRHFAATTWPHAGVSLGETALRLGHSVDTLVSTSVGALQGDELIANGFIDKYRAGYHDRPNTSPQQLITP